jgi:hypothetical protein
MFTPFRPVKDFTLRIIFLRTAFPGQSSTRGFAPGYYMPPFQG